MGTETIARTSSFNLPLLPARIRGIVLPSVLVQTIFARRQLPPERRGRIFLDWQCLRLVAFNQTFKQSKDDCP
jgi:hypothetical protein